MKVKGRGRLLIVGLCVDGGGRRCRALGGVGSGFGFDCGVGFGLAVESMRKRFEGGWRLKRRYPARKGVDRKRT